MKIVLDAMGSDNHPGPEIDAALQAFRLWGDPILMTGPEAVLHEALEDHSDASGAVHVIHAPEVLGMTDKPAEAAKRKSDSSMAVGMALLKSGEAEAFVTAGNTGGAMATALFTLGRIRGIKRPALCPVFPVRNGQTIVLDIGANTDCRPEFLVQFASMGAIYAEIVFGIRQPRIGLLSTGEEPGKGNELIKCTYPLFDSLGIHFVGNIEPKDLYNGAADVVVTDGFTGNIFLKTSEAVSALLVDLIRETIRSSPVTAVGGLLARPAFRKVHRILDPSEYGAVPLLGVDGLVFIGHGRSNAKALVSALRAARRAVAGGLMEALRDRLRKTSKTGAIREAG